MSAECWAVNNTGSHCFHDTHCCECGAISREARCPICNSDPCSCAEDEDLEQKWEETAKRNAPLHEKAEKEFFEKLKYKHKPLPANALTSWPYIHSKMEAAKHLNELKDE